MSKFGDKLRAKGQRIMDAGDKPAERPAAADAPLPIRTPVTPMGNIALLQPTIDLLNDRTKAAEQRALEADVKAQDAERRASELALQLADTVAEANWDEIVLVPGRRRRLTEVEYNELKENIRLNKLSTPLSVRRLPDGRFELISGYNRAAILQELGYPSAPISVREVEDDAVERLAFYTNLHQAALPDFEKFRGFQAERDRHAVRPTRSELARQAGVDHREVSRLFAYEDLPARALELLDEHPRAMGASCAIELARLVAGGFDDKVVEAVQKLVSGELDQAGAIAFVTRPEHRPAPARVEPTKIRSGRVDFCSYVGRGKTLRIDFKTEEQRVAAEAAVDSVLKELARKKD